MRVLFTTYPERTHFLSMAPLAWALRTAGHEVRFASQPQFTDEITQAGLTAVPVGGGRDLWQIVARDPSWLGDTGSGGMPMPYDAADRPTDEITWEYLRDGYAGRVKRWHKVSNVPLVSGLVELARQWQPDLIIWEPLTYAGGIAAKATGAAHARFVFGIDMYAKTRDHFLRLKEKQPPADRSDPMAEWLGSYAEAHGHEFDEDMITGQVTIDVVPPSLQRRAERRYLPLRYVPYGGPASVPKWLWKKPDKPRVALTLGLSAMDHGGEYAVGLQELLDALADLDIELVATIAEAEQRKLVRVPANTRLVSYAPLDALAATCSAVINHGGFGTLATTALRGVPQLILPWDNDGPALAAGAAAIGAALVLNPRETTGADIRSGVLRLLSEPEFRAGAQKLRAEMLATPAPNDLVATLEQLVADHRARSARPSVERG